MSSPDAARLTAGPGATAGLSPRRRRVAALTLLTLPLLTAPLVAAPAARAHGALHAETATGKAKGKQQGKQQGAAASSQAAAVDEHAKEHAGVERLIERIHDGLPKGEKAALKAKALGTRASDPKATRLADQAVGPASEFGAWTTAPFPAPTYGIHSMLLPTGRILMFSMGTGHSAGRPGLQNLGQDVNNDGQAAIWDPSKGTGLTAFKRVAPPPISLDDPQKRKGYDKLRDAPVYCSGHVQMADGRILVAGGNLEAGKGGYGLKLLFVFDPWTETWVRQKDMKVARWYPTVTRLPSGQTIILSGRDENGRMRPEVEVYPGVGEKIPGIETSAQPVNGSAQVKGSKPAFAFYPFVNVLRSGKVAMTGPTQGDNGILDTNTWLWKRSVGFTNGDNGYPSSFPEPSTYDGPERIYGLGGLTTGNSLSRFVSSYRPEIDARWKAEPSLKLARRNSPAVLLPDGTVAAIGGGLRDLRATDPTSAWPTRRQPELWDPVTHEWRLGPAQQRPRGYHSSALLLPDGRVMSVGDDVASTLFDTNLNDTLDTTIELYSPPYLFKGPRPVITSSPAKVNYGGEFSFTVQGDASAIARVTVVAPGSNTHGMDMNQRHLDLRIVRRSGNTLTVIAPPNAAAAPPGDYLLWALSPQGAPSVGRFLQFQPVGAPGHPQGAGAPAWSGEPISTTPDGTTPTDPTEPTDPIEPTDPAPPTKAPRPWWWPPFLPWNG